MTTNLPIEYTAYLKKHGKFNLANFVARRDLRNTKLLVFLHWFIPSVIGTEKWRRDQKTTLFSDIVTVSDEAYLYVIVESNYDKWLYMSKRTVRVYVTETLILIRMATNHLTMYSNNRLILQKQTADMIQTVRRLVTQAVDLLLQVQRDLSTYSAMAGVKPEDNVIAIS